MVSGRTSRAATRRPRASWASTSRSGRRTPTASTSSATSKAGASAPPRSPGAARPGIWEGLVPGIGNGARYKYRIVSRRRRLPGGQGGSLRVPLRGAARDRVHRLGPRLPVGRRRMDERAARQERAGRADVDLRGPPRLVDARPRGEAPLARLPRARAQAGGARPALRLHAHRADAGRRTPVLPVVGLPGDRLLRAHVALRHAPGLHVVRRPPAPAGDRRDPRLDAGALPDRRTRPDLLRRHAPLRTRRSAQGDARRVGQRDLQLRPQRGAHAS